MSNMRRDVPPRHARRDGVRPKSPAEALEPGRAPSRPRGVKPKRERRAVSSFVRIVSSVMTVVLIMMVATGGFMLYMRHLYERPGPLTYAQTVVIPKGAGSNDIAERLEREGVISSRWAFMINYLVQKRFGSEPVTLKHGEYLFKQSASLRDVMSIIADGKSVQYRVTIPEGLTSQQIVERLRDEENLTGEVTQIPAEGSLLPETYSIEKGMSRQELLLRMQAKQQQVLNSAWERRQPDTPLKTPEEAVVLASIIEKETGRADERERIAGVFTNRLRKGMPLQSDPTILYGIYGGGVQWGKPIYQSEKEAKNAHNTYQMRGLPQTPICNPGRAALEAAVNPANTSDLFFVADGMGGHIFSATLKDHNAAVQNWRKIEREMRARQETMRGNDVEKGGGDETAVPSPSAEPASDGGSQKPVANPVTTVPEVAEAEPDAPQQASSIPLPIRKPKN